MTGKVVVIGAGISGLATANDLAVRGFDVQVLERQVKIGGNAVSERFGGFLMEHGPSTLNAAFPQAMEMVSALGLDSRAVDLGPGVRKRYLRDRGALHGISVNRLGFLLSGYLSLGARLSLAAELFRPIKPGSDEETIHAFVLRRFGLEFADKVIEPLTAGIFMGDSKELSISGVFPKLVEMEQRFGSVMRGVIAARRGDEPGRRLFSLPNGIAELPAALASGLASRVRSGVTVARIARSGHGFTIATAKHGSLHANAVVLAVQPHVASALLEPLDVDAADASAGIAAPPIAVVFLGYRRDQVDHPLDSLGFLSTKQDGQVITGAQFASTMFEKRAPAEHAAISCYVGGARNPDLAVRPARELAALVHQELADLLGISGKPVVARTRHWPRGLPHYTMGHAARRSAIEKASQRVPGLFLTGNYLNGVSVTNCLEQARATADAICRELPVADRRFIASARPAI